VRLEVEHDDFLDAERDPVDPRVTPWIEIGMEPALTAFGVVVDAATGQPVEMYGIAARVTRGGDGGRRSRFGGGERGDEEVEAALREARAVIVQQRVGGSGEFPGRTPRPSRHAEGEFSLPQLEPGDYLFDIDAPGYVKVAAGAVALAPGKTGPLTFRVERGVVLTGKVSRRDGTPVAAADVQIHVAEPVLPTADNEGRGERGGRNGRSNRGRRGGFGGFRRPLARASTDQQGFFRMAPLRPGPFELQVEADGLMDYAQPTFVLSGSGPEHVVDIKMVAGGAIHGAVIGYEPGDGGNVMFTHTDGTRHTARVEVATGEYRIEGLPAGGYFATRMPARGGENQRRMIVQFLSQGERQPDVFVGEGAAIRYDVPAQDENFGAVSGEVWLNGAPAAGAQVQLSPQEQSGASESAESGFRRMAVRRMLSATVRGDGSFEIQAAPPGAYVLQVSAGSGRGRDSGRNAGRGGRRSGGGSLHREAVFVTAGGVVSVRIQVATSKIEFVVETPPELAETRLRVALVDATEAGSEPPQSWRRMASAQSFTVRDGTTGEQEVAPGSYRFAVTGRDAETVEGTVQVVAGSPNKIQISMKPQ